MAHNQAEEIPRWEHFPHPLNFNSIWDVRISVDYCSLIRSLGVFDSLTSYHFKTVPTVVSGGYDNWGVSPHLDIILNASITQLVE